MRNHEGMAVGLAEESALDAMGVLVTNADSPHAYGLPPASLQLFLLVAAAGPVGLAQSRVPKELKQDLALHLMPLELQELVAWERDNRGRPVYLVLTWRGEEAIASARPRPAGASAHAAARRRAVNTQRGC